MSKVEQAVERAVAPVIEELGYELVEVKYTAKPECTLTVFIDSAEGVSLNDCERVSTAIDPLIDELDPIATAYRLNVSSAGLDRPIRSDRDFARNTGREVEAKLYAPLPGTKEKLIEGVLEGRLDTVVRIRRFDGSLAEIESAQIALLTQLIRFE